MHSRAQQGTLGSSGSQKLSLTYSGLICMQMHGCVCMRALHPQVPQRVLPESFVRAIVGTQRLYDSIAAALLLRKMRMFHTWTLHLVRVSAALGCYQPEYALTSSSSMPCTPSINLVVTQAGSDVWPLPQPQPHPQP